MAISQPPGEFCQKAGQEPISCASHSPAAAAIQDAGLEEHGEAE